ncbi:hypothetical protein Ancab_037406, partial [Ancistrocladus abbreviatus]
AIDAYFEGINKSPSALLDAQIDLYKLIDQWQFKTFGFLSPSTKHMNATMDDDG